MKRMLRKLYHFIKYHHYMSWFGVVYREKRVGDKLIVRGFLKSFAMLDEVWKSKDYDLPGFAFEPGMKVLDIGANQGFFSLYAASKGATVHAYEPCRESFEVLKWNVDKNELGSLVSINNVAAGAKSGPLQLYVPLDRSQHIISGHVSTYNDSRGGAGLKVESVVAKSLDDILNDFGDDDCDFMKMDCEGAEYDILPSASKETLRRIRRVAIETHAGRGEELRDLLEASGFEILVFIRGRIGFLKAERI